MPAAVHLPHHAVLHGGFGRDGVRKFKRRVVGFEQTVAVAESGKGARKGGVRRHGERQRVGLRGEKLRGGGGNRRVQIPPKLFQRHLAVAVHIRFGLAVKPEAAGKRAGEVGDRARGEPLAVVIPTGFKPAGGGQHVDARVGQKGRFQRRGGLRAAARQKAVRKSAAADQRAGIAGVHDQQLFALYARKDVLQRRRAQRRFVFAVAQHQINLPVVRGGEHAVGAQVEDGEIGLVRVAECVVHGGLQAPDGADGAILDGKVAEVQPRADQRGTDDVQIAGDGIAQIRQGEKVVAGDEQRARLPQRPRGQREQQQKNDERENPSHNRRPPFFRNGG